MLKNMFILIAIFFSISGCTKTVVAPTFNPNTKLIIPVSSDKWELGTLQLAVRNKNGCGEFSKNMLPNVFDKDLVFALEEGKDMFFHIARSDARNQCSYYGIFYAVKGNEYLLNIKAVDQTCDVSLIETSKNGVKNKIKTYPTHASPIDGIKVCENKDRL